MTQEKLERLQEKIEKNYKEFCEKMLKKDKIDIINYAYMIACYNEVADCVDCFDYEYPPFDEFIFDNMLAFEGNIIDKIWRNWMDYGHPERYNFFNYEDLVDIIVDTFKN